MKYCGKTIGSGMGYNRTCGGNWMGNTSVCESCRQKKIRQETNRIKLENARLQNKILKKQLSEIKSKDSL